MTVSIVQQLAVPEQFPRATLKTAVGGSVSFPVTPSIVVFHRGFWCAHCRMQLSELANHVWQFRRAGVPLIAVSADDMRGVRSMSALLDHALPIVTDRRLKLISALGLAAGDPHVEHQIARPAVFGVGLDGSIEYRFVGRDKSDRPPPALLVLAAERLATLCD